MAFFYVISCTLFHLVLAGQKYKDLKCVVVVILIVVAIIVVIIVVVAVIIGVTMELPRVVSK
jgi:hypothetical protein